MAAKDKDTTSTTEYIVSYDAVDGARRTANALDEPGYQQVISDLLEDENRRQLLASSVGLAVEPHEHNFKIHKVVTTATDVTP